MSTYDIPINIMDLCCPIGLEIMRNPVTLEDGTTYEKDFILKWLKKSNKSPLTGSELKNKNFYENITLRTFIDQIVEKYPELEEQRYSNKYEDNMEIVNEAILNKKFNILSKYKKFTFNGLTKMHKDIIPLEWFLKNCTNINIIYHVINNIADLNETNKNKDRLLNYIIMFSQSSHITAILNKYSFDIDYMNKDGLHPLHLMVKHEKKSNIKIFIEKNSTNVNSLDVHKHNILHYAAQRSNIRTLKFLLDNYKIETKQKNNNGETFINILIKNRSIGDNEKIELLNNILLN